MSASHALGQRTLLDSREAAVLARLMLSDFGRLNPELAVKIAISDRRSAGAAGASKSRNA